MTITPTIQRDLYAWTAAIANAREDYQLRPTRACRRPACDNLADGLFCGVHLRDNAKAAERGRVRRAA